MAKAVMVMDMPAACLTCKGLGRLKGGFLVPDKWYCRFDCMAREIDDNSPYMRFGRPDWCPLIPEPEPIKKYSVARIIDEAQEKQVDPPFAFGYIEGWDACLDALEGKTDE